MSLNKNRYENPNCTLGRLLVKQGLLTEADLKDWNAEEAFPISHFAEKGCFTESSALHAVARALHIRVFDLSTPEVQKSVIALMESRELSCIEPQTWKDAKVVPIELVDRRLKVAMANPLDRSVIEALGFILGFSVTISVASEREIVAVLTRADTSRVCVGLESLDDGDISVSFDDGETVSADDGSGIDVSAAPVVKLANQILIESVTVKASDIHLAPERDRLVVKVRVDGMLRELLSVPRKLQGAVISRLKLLSGIDIAEKRKPQDGRMRFRSPLGEREMRCSTAPTMNGEAMVIRILSNSSAKSDFESLGIDSFIIGELKKALAAPSRIVLVCGPTGSGKTSTLYSAVSYLRGEKSHIVTIEDPVECRLDGINQIQVNHRIGLDFAKGLRSILRLDPDIIMVGEIRDSETAVTAMQAAQTGHLVLSTIHTNTAAAAVTRLIDLGAPSYIVASALGAVLAQRLVRCLCQACCVPIPAEERERAERLGLKVDAMMAPVGCPECSFSGYRGRTAICSWLPVTDRVREAIRRRESEKVIEVLASKAGFTSLSKAGRELVNKGVTSLHEVERVLGLLDAELDGARGLSLLDKVQITGGAVEEEESDEAVGL